LSFNPCDFAIKKHTVKKMVIIDICLIIFMKNN
jgi:hypothetical protein